MWKITTPTDIVYKTMRGGRVPTLRVFTSTHITKTKTTTTLHFIAATGFDDRVFTSTTHTNVAVLHVLLKCLFVGGFVTFTHWCVGVNVFLARHAIVVGWNTTHKTRFLVANKTIAQWYAVFFACPTHDVTAIWGRAMMQRGVNGDRRFHLFAVNCIKMFQAHDFS